MTINDFINNGQFDPPAKIRIEAYLGIECGDVDETVIEYDSAIMTAVPAKLLQHDIIAMDVSDDGYLVIEYDKNEYMGPFDE